MPLETNFNIDPYNNDNDPLKNYYRVLFKPGLAVQNRELHQIQDYSQIQIERFADNIFKSGTIVDGCNFSFNNRYPYVKLVDNSIDGVTIIPEDLISYIAKNDQGLTAFISDGEDGFESTAPDLKTIFVKYTNSGVDGETNAFSPGDTLTIQSSDYQIFKVNVQAGAAGFSNSDVLVFTSALIANVTSGSISNGDFLIQTSTGANVEIIEVDSATLASSGQSILKIKPRNADLANASVNSVAWTINQYEELVTPGNTATVYVDSVVGISAQGQIITNGIGKVTSITMTNGGEDYTIPPHVSVQSANNLSGINALNLIALNYYTQVKVAANSDSVGFGYSFSVGEGNIYQKGHMVRVSPQSIIVDKYSQSPNNVVVGFKTIETIVTANEDETLFDNTIGDNFNAPGADRLKLTPELVLLTVEEASSNTEFNPLVEWSGGQPYKQNKSTQYSRIGDQMAQTTFDESGNFVVDTFQISTAATANALNDSKYYTVVVDPGQAYISGYKVQTLRNFYIDVQKGLDTLQSNNIISLGYGSYVQIKEVGGIFQFSTGDTVDLYDTSKGFLSNTALISAGNTAPVGTKIGTSRIRSLVNQSGTPGDPAAVYKLYLFDIKMNQGKNFDDVRSVYYNGSSYKGIADIVVTTTAAGSNVAQLENKDYEKLLFPSGAESVKSTQNTTYTYRTIDQTLSFANSGLITKSIASNPNEFYPYTGNLSSSQLSELMIIPVGNNLVQYTDLTGTLSVNTSNTLVTGSGTLFLNDFAPGDYLRANGGLTNTQIKKVVSIINSTALTVDSVFAFTNATCTFKRVFPKNVPIPFGQRLGLTANVDSNGNILTAKLAHSNNLSLTLEGTATINAAVVCNIKRTNVTSSSKTANRNKFIKIYCGNNEGSTTGPWPVGVPDVFRLRNVYIGNSSVNSTSNNISTYFYIDHNQTQNFYDISWLYMNPRKKYPLANTDYLLVEFDYFTRTDGYFDTVSYLNTSNSEQIATLDATPLANLGSSATSYEVPEVYTAKGEYFDLLNCIDFRPAVSNTVAPGANATSAPLNPSVVLSFGNTADPANDKKFPLPDSSMETKLTQYLGRVDSVFIGGEKGDIYVLKGIPAADPRKRYEANHPKQSLKLQTITVPPYPNVTGAISSDTLNKLSTGIANERFSGIRWKNRVVTAILSSYEFQLSQPMVYTMEDIAQLERRIKDLEYYVSLSILETSITNKTIPSSIDKSLNRFKFGFFADDFSTESYSDVENPQYAASIETEGDLSYGISKSPLETDSNWANADKSSADSKILSPTKLVQKSTNRAVPPKFIWSLPHVIDNLPYIDHEIISQDYATTETPDANTPSEECVPVVSTVTVPSSNGYIYVKDNNRSVATRNITLGTKSGTVKMYFDDKATYVKYDVYKNGVLVATTAAAANQVSVLTTAEKSFLKNTTTQTGFTLQTSSFVRSGDKVAGSGKLSWTHNPSTGRNYVVTAAQGTGLDWEYLIEYPLSAPTTTKTIIDPCKIIKTEVSLKKTSPGNVPYVGTIIIDQTQGLAWSCSKRFAINNTRLTGLLITARGLKPNSIHKFYVDGTDMSKWCEYLPSNVYLPAGDNWEAFQAIYTNNLNNLGKSLITDPEGKLKFVFTQPATGEGSSYSWFKNIFKSLNKTSFGSSGYSTFALSATNSVATKLVALRTVKGTIPTTPAGLP